MSVVSRSTDSLSHAAGTSYRASAMDMLRSDSRVVGALGPADFGGLSRVSARLTALAAAGPHTRVALRATSSSSQWAYHPERVLDNVFPAAPMTAADLGARLTEFSRSSSESEPFRARLAGDYLLLDLSHGLCDALLPIDLFAYLSDPRDDAPLPGWADGSVLAHPLPRTLASWIARNPRKVVDMVYGRLRPTKAGAYVAPPADDAPPPSRPWGRSPTIAVASSAPGIADRIRQWRKDTGEEASVSAILSASLASALAEVGIPLAQSATVLFDCRRYVRSRKTVVGNFAAGLDFPSVDPTSHRQLHEALSVAIAKGRPIAAAALSSVKYLRTPSAVSGVYTDRVATEPVANLVFSDLGYVRKLDDAAWLADPGGRAVYGLSEPAEPEMVVLSTHRIGGVLYVSASFHDNVFDTALIQSALDLAVADPIRSIDAQES